MVWSATIPEVGDVLGTIIILTISLVLRVSAIDAFSSANMDIDEEMKLTGVHVRPRPARRLPGLIMGRTSFPARCRE